MNQRPEVVDWVRDGGGVLVDDNDIQSTVVDFIIECHGQNSLPCDFSHSAVVSTQWIRSCLEVHASVVEVTLLHYAFEVSVYIPVLIHLKICIGELLTRCWESSYLLSFALSHPIPRIRKLPFLYFTIWRERKTAVEELVLSTGR